MNLFKIPELMMVFDVESIGIHGEGFAVGWVVLNNIGKTVSEGYYACNPNTATGTDENRDWVNKNVPVLDYKCDSPVMVRNCFWTEWMNISKQGGILMGECVWPVEARFLNACIDQNFKDREWKGPYPLYDLSSILMAKNIDPLKIFDRLPNELPVHHPLMDARQSARILLESF